MGVLLYGDPGTGKSMLAQALANESGAELRPVDVTDIYKKMFGESEQQIKEIFARARQSDKPLILLLEEFDTTIGITENQSAGGADAARNAVAGLFKQEMDSLAQENVLVVATINNPDGIDDSLIRSGRFDAKIYVPMPDEAARQEIVTSVISKNMRGSDFEVYADDWMCQS